MHKKKERETQICTINRQTKTEAKVKKINTKYKDLNEDEHRKTNTSKQRLQAGWQKGKKKWVKI